MSFDIHRRAAAPGARGVAATPGAAFHRVAMSLRYRLSTGILIAAAGSMVLYALTLSSAVLAPGAVALRDRWIAATAPATDLVAALVPAVRTLRAGLAIAASPTRAAFVAHIVAMEWLVFGVATLIAAAPMLGQGTRLAAAFAAARAHRPRRERAAWRRALVGVFFVFVLLAAPFPGEWRHHGTRLSYNLATSDGGLFLPFMAFAAMWWASAYYLWLRLLALLARSAWL